MRACLLLMALLPLAGAQAQAEREGRLYALEQLQRLELAGSAQLRLVQGERNEVFIHGDEDVQRSVQLEQTGGRLLIRPAGGWKFWNSQRLQVEVMMRELQQLVLSGASDVHAPGPVRLAALQVNISGAGQARFDDLQARQLSFIISGAGEGQLRGRVSAMRLIVSGKGRLDAEQLRSNTAAVGISGIGSARLWVSDALEVKVSGIGEVEYWGSPEVRISSSSMSTVKALGEKR